MKKIVLASKSPRRSQLLRQMGHDFIVIESDADEVISENMTPAEIVESLSEQKAKNVRNKLKGGKDYIIIGADTIVTIDNNILGKPKDEEDARKMLKLLSGKVHKVYTGVSVIDSKTGYVDTFNQSTKVYIKDITGEEINKYILTKEPLDKAGSYGIQGYGGVFVDKICGDYFSVMGLPIGKLYDSLKGLI